VRIAPFDPLRPPLEFVGEVACPPYDVVTTSESRKIGERSGRSFIHVTRAEIQFGDDQDPHAPEVYQAAAARFRKMQDEGSFQRHGRRSLFVYRQRLGSHSQTGLMCCCHVDEYNDDTIKKHEKTRRDKEDDRTNHTVAIRAHAGPVFLTYKDDAAIDRLFEATTKGKPLYDFQADGVTHTVWEIENPEPWLEAFERVPAAYIADGHHRAASAARAATHFRKSDETQTGYEEYNWFMAVLFPGNTLRILPYNRVVKNLNGHTADGLLAALRKVCRVTEGASPAPAKAGLVSMYLGGTWYGLELPKPPAPARGEKADPVQSLDVTILQEKVLAPLLGIVDPRTSQDIDFVGGIHGPERLEAMVRSGKGLVAFSMFPTTVAQLMEISDAGAIMPPKSTWFEPKLRSGILVHTF